jgi:hypothetical protein
VLRGPHNTTPKISTEILGIYFWSLLWFFFLLEAIRFIDALADIWFLSRAETRQSAVRRFRSLLSLDRNSSKNDDV